MFKDRDRLAFTGVAEEDTFGVEFNEFNGGFLVLEFNEELGINDLLILGLTGGLTFEGRLESGVMAILPEKQYFQDLIFSNNGKYCGFTFRCNR